LIFGANRTSTADKTGWIGRESPKPDRADFLADGPARFASGRSLRPSFTNQNSSAGHSRVSPDKVDEIQPNDRQIKNLVPDQESRLAARKA
jgi:hypothetical protein